MDDFDIGSIDEVIHGRLRLGVMAYLAGEQVAEFNALKITNSMTRVVSPTPPQTAAKARAEGPAGLAAPRSLNVSQIATGMYTTVDQTLTQDVQPWGMSR